MSQSLPPPSPSKYLPGEMSPAAREFYRRLAEGQPLGTTRCERCAQSSFPPRERCATCGEELEWIELPGQGELYAFTTQETAVRFAAPAVLALADVGGVTLPGIVHAPYEELRIGQAVTIRTFEETETGLTLLQFVPGQPASTPRARQHALRTLWPAALLVSSRRHMM